MTNREKFKEEICNIAISGANLAVDKRALVPCECARIACINCIGHGEHCNDEIKKWAESEYIEPCPFEKDELVEVSDNGKQWVLRYFSHRENVLWYCYESGYTSRETNATGWWKYCRKYGTLGGLVKDKEEE